MVLEKNILKSNAVFTFLYHLQEALHLKFESPLPKDAFYKVELKFVRWFWSRRFKNVNNCNLFELFRNNPPLQKKTWLFI